jgi:hypothetical protein
MSASKRRGGMGNVQYLKRDYIVLPGPEDTASINRVRHLDLKTSIINCADGSFVHTENGFLGADISDGRNGNMKKSMLMMRVPHGRGPSQV